jgi:hypothetical protein
MLIFLKNAYARACEFFQRKTEQTKALAAKAVRSVEGEWIPAGAAVGGTGLTLAAGNAMAAAPDFSSLTAAVDYSTAITAVLLVAAGLAGVYIVIAGIRLILPMLKGGRG